MMTGTFAPFRNRDFTVYWVAGLFSNVGWMIQMVGASWLMIALDGTPNMVALVQTSFALPMILFSLPAGAAADAFGRRATVVSAQSWLLTFSVALAILAYLGVLGPWSLLVFTFLIGTGKAVTNPGWQTMVAEIVTRKDVPAAVSLNSIGINIARTTGPAIGGVLVAMVGAFAAFVVNAVVNLGVIVVASRWKRAASEAQLPPERVAAAMVDGLRYVALSPNLLRLTLRGFVFNFAGTSVMALLPLIARDIVGGGPEVYGMLFGSFGVGGLSGAVAASRLRQRLTVEGMARIGFVVSAVSAVGIAFGTILPIAILGVGMAGASWLLVLATFNTYVQLASPRWVLGRCQALLQTANFSGVAVGGIVWGQFAAGLDTPSALLISAAALTLGAMIGLVSKIKDFDTGGLQSNPDWRAPEFALDILPKSGPIVTTLEYRIPEDRVPRFLQLMQDRWRRRRRDGVRSWSLSRDLMDPEVWFERFETPTWLDSMRHHSRRTLAGSKLADEIRQLHQGDRVSVRYELVRPMSAVRSIDTGRL